MTDYTKLVTALRNNDWSDACPCCDEAMCKDADCIIFQAADAIEALQAEIDKANKSADAYRVMYFAKRGDITIEKVRELDEIDCHFHSALIRLMYRRIEELEAQLRKQGDIVRCGECKYRTELAPTKWHPCVDMAVNDDWFCADGEREVQE